MHRSTGSTRAPRGARPIRAPRRGAACPAAVWAGALLALCNTCNIDLSSAMARKMAKNEQKYPADVYRGKYRLEH